MHFHKIVPNIPTPLFKYHWKQKLIKIATYFSVSWGSSRQLLKSALIQPQKVTKTTTQMLRQVKMLLNLVDSLTPMHNIKVKDNVIIKAQKSG